MSVSFFPKHCGPADLFGCVTKIMRTPEQQSRSMLNARRLTGAHPRGRSLNTTSPELGT
jgi:hypothetical protein